MAPVAEFNTYDILKQRYLVLTREALTALKQRVKDNTDAPLIPPPRPNRPPARRANPMVTLRRPPKYERSGPVLDPYQVVIRPLITEKATHLSERHNAYTFEVNPLATKTEIKDADRGPVQRQGRSTSGPRTAAASRAATGSRSAGCGTGKRRSSRSTRNTGSISIERRMASGQCLLATGDRHSFRIPSDGHSHLQTDHRRAPQFVGQRLLRADRQEQEAREEA